MRLKNINIFYSAGQYVSSAKENTGTNILMNRTYIYWLMQLSGWGLYAAVNLFALAAFEEKTYHDYLVWIFVCAVGLYFTHVYRGYIKKNNWHTSTLRQLVVRVLVASAIIGISMYILGFSFNFFIGGFEIGKYKIVNTLFSIINLSSVIFFWSLIYFSVHFFDNYKRVQIESLIWEAAVKDFELKTLKSQINPHFMFNAMNSIRALIEGEPKKAQAALTKLSNLLRYSLKIERTETVPLEEEIKTVEDYLELESIRYEERISYSINIDPLSAKIEIPPMMVQTLVENGIKHGIAKKTEGGKIFVNSHVENSTLIIQIINSGNIKEEEIKNSKGFGLSNTKHRLNLLYGENASFTITNSAGDFVLAEIKLPTGGKINESSYYR
ncbi:MAG: histidine kinase [Ignavibacteria bacterium CG_4_9_14_3_um_filter_36_18]|nr:MAG: histidine kinase [Ignavibacteria bacterium CG_4_9_14_3_um_filter_36_18]